MPAVEPPLSAADIGRYQIEEVRRGACRARVVCFDGLEALAQAEGDDSPPTYEARVSWGSWSSEFTIDTLAAREEDLARAARNHVDHYLAAIHVPTIVRDRNVRDPEPIPGAHPRGGYYAKDRLAGGVIVDSDLAVLDPR